jgi:hypothetical protein
MLMVSGFQQRLLSIGWFDPPPPPATEDVAINELNVSRHNQEYLNHFVVIPCLMTFNW